MLILYEHPLSPYAQKIKIALREKGIDFELRLPDAIGSGQSPVEFMAANPRGEVPVLFDGNEALFDSTIILEYIEDKWPSPSLRAPSPLLQARARLIEEVMDSHYEPINWGLGEISFFKRAEGALKETIERNAARQVRSFQSWLTRQLGANSWMTGADFGWADLSVVPYLNGSAGFGLGPADDSPLGEWLARANARPAVAKTAQEAAASIAGMETAAAAVESGLFKREYRDHRLEWMIKTGGLDVVLKGLENDNIRFTGEFS